jgi:hypothetical protein
VVKAQLQQQWASRPCGTATPRSTARAAAPGEKADAIGARHFWQASSVECHVVAAVSVVPKIRLAPAASQAPAGRPLSKSQPAKTILPANRLPPSSKVCGNGGGIIRKYGLNSEWRLRPQSMDG